MTEDTSEADHRATGSDRRAEHDPATLERIHDRRERLAPAIGRAWTDDEPWRFLTDLTAIGSRMAGSEGERRAADLVVDAFERAGLRNVRTDPFGIAAWDRGSTELHVTTPGRDGSDRTRSFEALALPYSPAGNVGAHSST